MSYGKQKERKQSTSEDHLVPMNSNEALGEICGDNLIHTVEH